MAPTYATSMTQISPGCGLGFRILQFPAVNFLAGSEQKIVGEFHFFLFGRKFKNAARDGSSFTVGEFGQFGNDFRGTHKRTITESEEQGNRHDRQS